MEILSPPFAPPRTVIFCRFLRVGGKQKIATRNRTGDTRIFSPLLYQLSYGTVVSRLRLQRYAFYFNLQIIFEKNNLELLFYAMNKFIRFKFNFNLCEIDNIFRNIMFNQLA